MKQLFVPYAIAKKLKELSFKEMCLAYYNPVVAEDSEPIFKLAKIPADYNYESKFNEINPVMSAPLIQQVITWFRVEHDIHIELVCGHDEDKVWWDWYVTPIRLGYNYDHHVNSEAGNLHYEDAILDAISNAIKTISSDDDWENRPNRCAGELKLLGGDGEYGEGMDKPFYMKCKVCGNTDFYGVEECQKGCHYDTSYDNETDDDNDEE